MHERENVQRRGILELEEMKKKVFTEKKLLQSEIDEKIATECDNKDKENDAGEDEEELEDPDESECEDDSSEDDSSEDDNENERSEADESKSDGVFSKYTLDASPRITQPDITVKAELETDIYNGDTIIIGAISCSKFMSFVKSTDPNITFTAKSLTEQSPGNNMTRIDTLRLMTIKKMYPLLKFKAVRLKIF